MNYETEQKALKKINDMAKETKAQYDRYGRDGLYNTLYSQLIGALNLLTALTGKKYVINADGTIEELKRTELKNL
jgi:hypothetical protein